MVSNLRHEFRVVSITLSRSTAPVEVREQLACQEWASLLAPYTDLLREWAIISTCHHFELYFVVDSETFDEVLSQLCRYLSTHIATFSLSDSAFSSVEVDEMWRVRADADVADHLCRVATGLDSLVLGEAQIQGQVISAYTTALENGTIGPLLSALFRTAIRSGKRARTETQISTHAASMSSIALNMAARYFANFAQANVLVIGAGEMSRLALKALLQRHVTHVTVANRTLARAEAALLNPQWRAAGLAEVAGALHAYDVIFCATSAPDYVIALEQMTEARLRHDGGHTQVMIDLAVPRDVDPAIRQLPGVVLIDVDDLRQGLDQSLENRRGALPLVDAIIEEELGRWQAEQRELVLRPLVVELRQRAERIRQHEIDRTMRQLPAMDEQTRDHIQHLSRALVNKLLHEPTIRIKELAKSEAPELYLSAICDIFGLDANFNSPSYPENAELRGELSAE